MPETKDEMLGRKIRNSMERRFIMSDSPPICTIPRLSRDEVRAMMEIRFGCKGCEKPPRDPRCEALCASELDGYVEGYLMGQEHRTE